MDEQTVLVRYWTHLLYKKHSRMERMHVILDDEAIVAWDRDAADNINARIDSIDVTDPKDDGTYSPLMGKYEVILENKGGWRYMPWGQWVCVRQGPNWPADVHPTFALANEWLRCLRCLRGEW